MKKNILVRKGVVVGIILLFVGASAVPSISKNVERDVGNVEQISDASSSKEKDTRVDAQENNPERYDIATFDRDQGLVGYWHFNEGNGNIAHDSSGNGNNGTISGPTWTAGISGSALYFHDGGQYYNGDGVTVPHSSSVDIKGPFSVEAWIKATGSENYYAIVDKYHYILEPNSQGFTLYLTAGRIRLSVYSSPHAGGNVCGTTELRDNQWHYVAGTWDGSYARVYVDGQMEGQVPWSYAPTSTTNPLSIGKRWSGWGGYMPFYGTIDEVRLYTRALSPAEVIDHSQEHPVPGSPSDDQAKPDYNIDFILALKEYYEKVKNYVNTKWEKIRDLYNPFLDKGEKQKKQEELRGFPTLQTLKEKVSNFYSFISNILYGNRIITFTPVDEGTLMDNNGEKSVLKDVTIPFDKIELKKTGLKCALTFTLDGSDFTIYIERIDVTYTVLGVVIGQDFGIQLSTEIIDLGPVEITPTFSLFVGPSMNGMPTLGYYGQVVINCFDHTLTITVNDPMSLRNTAGRAGVYVGDEVAAYDGVGAGVSLEAGVYESVLISELDPLEYTDRLYQCWQQHGGTEYGGKLVDMLMKGLTINGCVVGSLPPSATVGVDFGISGEAGLGAGEEAPGAEADVAVNVMQSYSAGMSIPASSYSDMILDNNKTLSEFFIAAETASSVVVKIMNAVGIINKAKVLWDEGDILSSAYWTAARRADTLQNNINDAAQKDITITASQGYGIGVDLPYVDFEGQICMGSETTLYTLIELFAGTKYSIPLYGDILLPDLDALWDEGYTGSYLTKSVGLSISFGGFPAGIKLGADKDLLKFTIEGTGDKSGKNTLMLPHINQNETNVTVLSDQGTDTNGDGFYDELTVTVKLRVNSSSNYTLGGMLFKNLTCVGFAMNTSFFIAGDHVLSLHFTGLHLRNQHLNGSYEFGAFVGRENEDGVQFVNLSFYTTSSYQTTDFQPSYLTITNLSHVGVDSNANGLYDNLQVNVTVHTTTQEKVKITGVLKNDNITLMNESYFNISPGNNQRFLLFNGKAIRTSGSDAPYNLTISAMNERGAFLNISNLTITGYTYDDFELPNASLSNTYTESAIDTNSDGYYDYLALDVGVNVTVPGNYTVDAYLKANESLLFLSNTTHLDLMTRQVRLFADGLAVRALKSNQSFSLLRVRLSQNQTIFGIRFNPYTTALWNYTDFTLPNALLAHVFTDQGIDLDGNGRYDVLKITVGMNVTKAGRYMVVGSLNCNGSYVYAGNNVSLAQGTTAVELRFDGKGIYEKGYSGVYKLERVGVLQNDTYIDYLNGCYNTSRYNSTDFEKYNKKPFANFSYTPLYPAINQMVTFNASSSMDPDGSIVNYTWIFSDGTQKYGPIVTRSYQVTGNYLIILIVKDNASDTSMRTREITVSNPPYIPSDPQPVNDTYNVPVQTNLSWTGGDPDPGDTVTYDIYLGTTTLPPKLVSNHTGTSYSVSALAYDALYYWRIVSWDQYGHRTDGPLWHFLTVVNPLLVPEEEWNRSFGGTGYEAGMCVRQTTDGGYVVLGYSEAYGGAVYLVKTNTTGGTQWERYFGGTDYDFSFSGQQTTDGGYIIVGGTYSYGVGCDVYLIKTNSTGIKQWDKNFGGTNFDIGWSVNQTTDGGYIIAGYTTSYGAGSSDVWLIKTDQNGNKQWDKTFGGTGEDGAEYVQQTTDGGYIIVGYTNSYGTGRGNIWLVKTNNTGVKQWDKTFGAPLQNEVAQGHAVQQTTDGGYIIVGETDFQSFNTDDVYLIKTNSTGYMQWNKTFGGSSMDQGYSVQQTTDGGYIIVGGTYSYSPQGAVWLIKTNSTGTRQWYKIIGGQNPDQGRFVQQTTDGGYIITGFTSTYGVGGNIWLIKIAQENQPPYTPSAPSPSNGSTGVFINADLSWIGGDPDLGDTVTYDVYFGTTNPPPKVIANQSSTSYDPGTMNYSTTYYWKIVSWDNHGTSTSGPVWSFTTESQLVQPPTTPIHVADGCHTHNHPNDMNKGIGKLPCFVQPPHGVVQTFSTTCVNTGEIYYKFFFGDGQDSGWLGPYTSGQVATATHDYNNIGIFQVTAKAKVDTIESLPSPPLSVRMYKSGDINGDNLVDFGDINPFVLVLASGINAYYTSYPNGYYYTSDINNDCSVDFGDINPFVQELSSCPP